MSDVMLFGVLRMPYELAMSTELSRRQFYSRSQQAADTIDSLTRERDEARAEAQALRADAELGEIVLAEVADFCKAADRVCIATVQRRLGIRWKHAERLVHAVVARGMVEGMPATELAQAGAAIDSARSA